MKNFFLLTVFIFLSFKIGAQDSLVVNLNYNMEGSVVFYKLNNYNIQLSKQTILDNKSIFKHQLIRKIQNSKKEQDTIFINELIKENKIALYQVILFAGLKAGKFKITNLNTGEVIKQILYTAKTGRLNGYERIIDLSSGTVILERKPIFIGCPDF